MNRLMKRFVSAVSFQAITASGVVAAEKINFAFSSIIGSQTPLWIAKE
jgi:hypothetical protein